MRPARRLLSSVFAGSLAVLPSWLPAQTPVPDLIVALRSTISETQRWDAALSLGTATFADAAERDAARAALQEALSSRDAGLRVNAATSLGRLGDPQSVDALSSAMFDRSPMVRQASANALGRIGDERAARALFKAFRDPNPTVRAYAVHALGRTGQGIGINELEAILATKSDEPNAPLRAEAAKALEAMGSYGVTALERGLSSDDPTVRAFSARSLGNIGNPSAVAPLIKAFADADPRVAAEASLAIGKLGEPAIPRLLENMASERANTRMNVARALGGIGSPAVGPVRNAYNNATSRIAELLDERAVAVAVAEAQRQRVVLPPTTPSAPTPTAQPADTGEDAFGMPELTDPEIRREASRLKSRMKSIKRRTQRAEELVRLRQREDGYNERYDSAQAFLNGEEPPKAVGVGNTGVQPFLVTIPEREPNVSLPAAPNVEPQTSGQLPTTRPLRVIDREIEALSRQAQAAILALGSIGNDEAVTALGEIVRQAELEDATVAVEALGRTRNANAIPLLVNALGDATFAVSVRSNAATGLGRMRSDVARTALEQAAANDASASVRNAARSALSDLSASATP